MYKEEYNNIDAFPMCASDNAGGVFERYGMTLLDYFAGQVINGIYAATMSPMGLQNGNMEGAATEAYAQAAAMMEERKKYLQQ